MESSRTRPLLAAAGRARRRRRAARRDPGERDRHGRLSRRLPAPLGRAGRAVPSLLACGRRRRERPVRVGPGARAGCPRGEAAPVKVPAAFMPLCESVVLHRDPGRFGLLYRLLWRLQTEPGLRHDALDPDWVAARQMAQAVRRDMHKMTAFVRFRALDEGDGRGPLHVAWFEPEHHIVEATAPFFARRFTAMRWAILTPERSVHWEGRPGVRSGRAPRPGAAGRCRRGALAHLLPQHLQSGAAQAGDDETGDAEEILGQPARGGVDRPAGGGCR